MYDLSFVEKMTNNFSLCFENFSNYMNSFIHFISYTISYDDL